MVENKGMSRIKACVISGLVTWLVGLGTVLSFNAWSEIKFFGKTFFDVLDFLTANIMLPLGGLFIAIFAAWIMKRETTADELEMGQGPAYQSWRILVRFITPIAVIIVFLNAIGLI